MRNSSNLDGIRSIAVLMVVACHVLLLLTAGEDHPAYNIRALGHAGVGIFFVHTVMVLMASLDRHGPAAGPFYVRRFFRIYPLSIVIVLFMVLMQMAAKMPIDTGKVISNLLLVQNITEHSSLPYPLWSLPYEVQMYLVLPALYQVTRTRRPAMWASLLCVGSVAFMLALQPNSYEFTLLGYVPCFLPGVLAFVLARHAKPTASPMRLFGLVAGFGIVAIPMLVSAGLPEIPLLWCLCLSLGVTIPACREIRSGYFARGSKLAAKYSYGIYITHALALGALGGLLSGPAIVQWSAALILIPGLAYICYHGVEKHGIALGARVAAAIGSKRQNLGSAASVD